MSFEKELEQESSILREAEFQEEEEAIFQLFKILYKLRKINIK